MILPWTDLELGELHSQVIWACTVPGDESEISGREGKKIEKASRLKEPIITYQWPFQEPKLEVPTIDKAERPDLFYKIFEGLRLDL